MLYNATGEGLVYGVNCIPETFGHAKMNVGRKLVLWLQTAEKLTTHPKIQHFGLTPQLIRGKQGSHVGTGEKFYDFFLLRLSYHG